VEWSGRRIGVTNQNCGQIDAKRVMDYSGAVDEEDTEGLGDGRHAAGFCEDVVLTLCLQDPTNL